MNSDNLKNNLNGEREILPADEQKICDLIGKLDRVDCPKNFDFRLKARLASANKSEYQPSVWQTLRYVVPVAACVLIAAFVMVQAGMFSSVNQTGGTIAKATNPNILPFDEQSNQAKPSVVSNSNAPEIAAVTNKTSSTNSLPNMDIPSNSSENRYSFPKLSPQDNSTMSRDLGVRPNRNPIFPSGINPDQIKPKTNIEQGNRYLPLIDNLDFIGMETEFVGGKLRVKSVRENTVADKAGIKAGDIIESIGGTKITQSEATLKSNDLGKIIILRGGKILEFSL